MGFRFVFCPAIGVSKAQFYGAEVINIKIAKDQLNIIANYTLHLHNENLIKDHSNIGYIEKFIKGNWEEIEEDEI